MTKLSNLKIDNNTDAIVIEDDLIAARLPVENYERINKLNIQIYNLSVTNNLNRTAATSNTIQYKIFDSKCHAEDENGSFVLKVRKLFSHFSLIF